MRLLGEKAQTMGFLDLKSYMIGLAGAGRSIGTEQQGRLWGLDIISAALGQMAGKNYKTESGSVVTVNDAEAADVKKLLVDIELVQAGSGDPSPSNIRTITGWTGANIYHETAYDASAVPEISVPWQTEAGTVYGGTLNVTTGLLTVTWGASDLGDQIWVYNDTEYSYGHFSMNKTISGKAENSNFICSHYTNLDHRRNNLRDKEIGRYNNTSSGYNRMVIRDDDYTDAASFKAALSGVLIAYELASPVTYQLTAQQLTMLAGSNAIWADTGDVTVTYQAE